MFLFYILIRSGSKCNDILAKHRGAERKWAHKTEIRHERWHITKAEKIIDDSRAFSSVIRLKVFLN